MSKKAGSELAPFPNTFLIGVQKAGTTTLNDWLSQHPQVYGYASLKDIPLFVKFPSAEQLNKRLALETPSYNGQKVVLHSAVNYIFYPSLLEKISTVKPDAQLLLILRNPVGSEQRYGHDPASGTDPARGKIWAASSSSSPSLRSSSCLRA